MPIAKSINVGAHLLLREVVVGSTPDAESVVPVGLAWDFSRLCRLEFIYRWPTRLRGRSVIVSGNFPLLASVQADRIATRLLYLTVSSFSLELRL